MLRPEVGSFLVRVSSDASCMLMDTEAVSSNHLVAEWADPLVTSAVSMLPRPQLPKNMPGLGIHGLLIAIHVIIICLQIIFKKSAPHYK